MIRVVFTGPAFDSAGHSIIRNDLMIACKGIATVQSSVQPDTEYVVASRKDTVKAKKAAMRGIPVLAYPEFIARFLTGVAIRTGSKPCKYTDKIDVDSLVPVFLTGEQLATIDSL